MKSGGVGGVVRDRLLADVVDRLAEAADAGVGVGHVVTVRGRVVDRPRMTCSV